MLHVLKGPPLISGPTNTYSRQVRRLAGAIYDGVVNADGGTAATT